MSIRALQFLGDSPVESPERIRLDPTEETLSTRRRSQGVPTVILVRAADLAPLRALGDLVVDRGRKNKAKGLSGLLLGKQKVPLLEGSYSDPGQLRRGIRTLLGNAMARRERNLYIMGTDEGIFEQLWGQAVRGSGLADLPGRAAVEMPPPIWPLGPDPAFQLPWIRMRELLPPLDEDQKDKLRKLEKVIIGNSPSIELVREWVVRAARQDARVLILGESGTGKEVVARQIHNHSGRRGKIKAVNCGAIPSELLESELFGYVKGAFTGANSDKAGLWEEAKDGTLFLDEVGELRLDHQVKLLRALQEGTIRRVGETKEISVNARVIAATNRNLHVMVRAGQFRDDLFYRLLQFLICIPPLRSHPEDIPDMAVAFWRDITSDPTSTLPKDVLAELQRHPWPGNVRVLKAVLQNLHQMFYSGSRRVEGIGVEHLRAVHLLRESATTVFERHGADQGAGHQLVECLRHLRRVDEVVCACDLTLRPVGQAPPVDPREMEWVRTPLQYQLSELGALCQHRLLFHSEDAYLAVRRLADKLSRLQEGRLDLPRRWWEELEGEFRQVTSILFQEFKGIVARL